MLTEIMLLRLERNIAARGVPQFTLLEEIAFTIKAIFVIALGL